MNYVDIITVIAAPIVLYVLYLIFIDDAIQAYRASKAEKAEELRQKEEKKLVSARMAQIKLTSNDDKEIESFMVQHAINLNDDIAGQLISRIAQIRTDRELFNEDASLKSKFNTL